jgi:hypothetical protein
MRGWKAVLKVATRKSPRSSSPPKPAPPRQLNRSAPIRHRGRLSLAPPLELSRDQLYAMLADAVRNTIPKPS